MTTKDVNKLRATQKRYRDKNREKRNKANRDWYARNAGKMRKHMSEYRKTHKEVIYKANAEWQRNARAKYKHLVVQGYGGKCISCGQPEEIFMQIHHPGGNGKTDRERRGGNSLTLYKWLVDNNFPRGYELLCANCHYAISQKQRRNYVRK